ncbi:MAG: hypothetical protein FWF49_06650, partial [Oscillospiraceae bacterium]|nr:hypothetical protein [Oscillospiraceae bacterium]
HVLNAEGEKIQAVVGMEDVTVENLQDINLSVGGTMDSVALLEDVLQNKLRTALDALYPTATFTISFVDSVTGDPVDCQCIQCTLTNLGPGGEITTFVAHGSSITLAGLKPGSYTLEMDDPCAGYLLNDSVFHIVVDAMGNAAFNGVDVEDVPPVIELAEDTTRMAAQATITAPAAAAQESVPEPKTQPGAAEQETLAEPAAVPADTQYTVCTLTNQATGDTSTFYPDGDFLTFPDLEPGSYTLKIVDVCEGYPRSEKAFCIAVDTGGNVTFQEAAAAAPEPKAAAKAPAYRALRIKRRAFGQGETPQAR